MAWINMLEREQLSVKLDDKDEVALLEINDGGISPNYVTVRLSETEIDELIEVLQRIKRAIQ
ncbi:MULTISPECIES: hypothetical protein [Paenibacillus]|uniref:Uncharacterized protein n=2 Tax=Paenibacillus TaxID=44249 RepID=A0ABU6D568_9BACL|nr:MULTISPECIES: hypothetical protein [Paenibacillus]MBA2940430.1 hypothetical protein [Paenibacillus sp. CGMCC 1.16610]MCY9657939.1 hypothetical protein [Paenibacillus anseongense]MEB4792866.1 hypothetical protein [Paenibacillus chondroitinus]MVQ35607.1 hypothetical protein [Paenibacillus anseongense]